MTIEPVVDYEALTAAARPDPGLPTASEGADRAADGPSPGQQAAAAFAAAALRAVLEVLDRRRQPSQLRALLAAGLADSVGALRSAAPPGQVSAVLRRVRLQPADAAGGAYEISASYARGPRVHAMAGRVSAAGPGWRVTALHLG
ncbi:Rv3235 family protein [Mycolicibacterium brumae]|uniref:Alanine, arginine and proline rich protein n=1 Tax=Mycolicibacterium brumae TaxID=85968 RepID=A0A2G5PCR8_9MYCO|nr:Rv3235 family protein [Mycolicibacterium brumae]MCV7193213.1 hypothetical protein [Mycolicibacterium brumae]PIB75880.1 hypothetical protein CQY22_007435 [Mycolicibacterium brumae]RWA16650.1 hypothetical protein MBRU_07960 [Mycolicibacterium brumae DSM 44177]UWW09868.1 Rv3235 family protein [Mycolicibacterium brumae]